MQTVNVNIIDTEAGRNSLLSSLMYGSYAANRGYGMTHEQLLSIGIGNEQMRIQYETNNFTKQIPID